MKSTFAILTVLVISFCVATSASATDKSFFRYVYSETDEAKQNIEAGAIVNDEHVYSQQCLNRESKAVFGQYVGRGCEAGEYGDVSRAELFYDQFILDQNLWKKQRRGLNMGEHHQAVVVETMRLLDVLVDEVVQRKQASAKMDSKDKMSAEEMEHFRQAVFAKVARESKFFHLRKRGHAVAGNHPTMLLVGDKRANSATFYRSRGLMQINVESHRNLPLDVSIDLVKNMAYGINFFHSLWVKAKDKSCVKKYEELKGSKDFEPLYWLEYKRATYAAYNGGAGNFCRKEKMKYTVNNLLMAILLEPENSKKDYCEGFRQGHACVNEVGYLRTLKSVMPAENNKSIYAEYIRKSETKRPQIPYKDILKGNDFTALVVMDKAQTKKGRDRLFYHADGTICAPNKEGYKLLCSRNPEVAKCLIGGHPSPGRYAHVSETERLIDDVESLGFSRNKICSENVDGLVSVGGIIEIQKSRQNFRSLSTGRPIGTVRAGEKYQVLDYSFTGFSKGDGLSRRRYILRATNPTTGKAITGWIFAGTNSNKGDKYSFDKWAREVVPTRDVLEETALYVPLPGMEILAKKDLNQVNNVEDKRRITPFVEAGRKLEVEKVEVSGDGHEVYVKASGVQGLVYLGQAPSTIFDRAEVYGLGSAAANDLHTVEKPYELQRAAEKSKVNKD